jgi:hypothetical protein
VRRLAISLLLFLLVAASAHAATGSVIKVLPHYLDLKGHHTVSPSLYDRDAYQAKLRDNPALRSGMRFDVQWKAKPDETSHLKLRLETRGTTKGDLPKTLVREQAVTREGFFSQWSGILITGDDYKTLGEVTAWRVTLWDGDKLLSEQKSFLW